MSDGLFSSVELASGSDGRAGYRLHTLEVFNWGTFDRRVWRLTPGGETSLLTGDIGSGKSTLVDAVTTLLLPAHRIAYNKAAGAESRERTLRSYVEGYFKSERVESTGTSRPIGLRNHQSYSVVLGVFVNDGYDETVTIAQVFHQKDRAGQPDRFFVTSAKQLTIESDFTDFGSDLNELRRRLRAAGATISNAYPDYARQMRRLLGIRSEQALELFHQTVSMKSVGNLNDFVRSHMLEPVDASARVSAIVDHFDNLTKAHEAVRRARDQLEALDPLVSLADRYDDAAGRRHAAERQRDAVRLYVAELRLRLLTGEIAAHVGERATREREADEAERARRTLVSEREGFIAARAAAGGNRIGELERIESDARREADTRRSRRKRFAEQVSVAGLGAVDDRDTFEALVARVEAESATSREQRRTLDDRTAGLAGRRSAIRADADEVRADLMSLASRRNNIPRGHLSLRSALCRDLGLDDASLPFAGELVDVADGYDVWRGAAERVLRGFAMSLLVPQDQYAQVAEWVNGRRLTSVRDDGSTRGMRLTYERVPHRRVRLQPPPSGDGLVLAATLDVAPGPFADYLRDQLSRRADHRCAASMAEFREASRAVTVEGQVRSGDRHDKDDRSRIDDPRTWVLGWANERKIAALTAQLESLQAELLALEDELSALGRERDEVDARLDAMARLGEYAEWSELDWSEAESRASAARDELQRLLDGSSRLAEIERRMEENAHATAAVMRQQEQARGRVSILDDRIQRANRSRDEAQAFVDGQPVEVADGSRASYEDLAGRLGDGAPQTADDCARVELELGADLQKVLDRIDGELRGYALNLQNQMHDVRRRWPEATTEMDASVDSRGAFRKFRDRVATDDLPKFESDFKEQLNTNTIRELAGFNSWLRRQASEIDARIDRINEALGAIDYSPGRFITLVAERTVNQEVQAFRTDLRAATDDTIGGDDDRYSEQRFLEVKRIIERFRGREGHADSDKAWTRRVTDVRNWFTFSASERVHETGEEWEHYRDSDGKSGGQKEKLAYTILAASLAYQFGLEWGVERSKDFRFAVIDEAFGRGSDASTRYALDLFAKLGLQLLIVTPLQKVHVIEPYVRAIGFVDNPTGSASRLQTLTIEEFQAMRDAGG